MFIELNSHGQPFTLAKEHIVSLHSVDIPQDGVTQTWIYCVNGEQPYTVDESYQAVKFLLQIKPKGTNVH